MCHSFIKGNTDCVEGCQHYAAVQDVGLPYQCVSTCAANWFTVNSSVCVRCNANCAGGCTGPTARDCNACGYVVRAQPKTGWLVVNKVCANLRAFCNHNLFISNPSWEFCDAHRPIPSLSLQFARRLSFRYVHTCANALACHTHLQVCEPPWRMRDGMSFDVDSEWRRVRPVPQ